MARKKHGRRGPTRRVAAEQAPGRRKARIYREVKVDGAAYWTLFDSGARRTYVTEAVGRAAGMRPLAEPVRTALAGRRYVVTHGCILIGTVEGRGITADALVVSRLFPDEEGRPIDILLGMETMETWGIGLDMTHKRLDFTYYSREVVEG